MEELLNKLIEKGWKPFGFKGEETRIEIERDKDLDIQMFKLNWIIIEQHHRISGSLRNLTSKESGLWQFVCENKLIEMKYSDWAKNPCIVGEYPTLDCDIHYGWGDYHHWLMESALCNEEDLEKFLLENIKIS